MVKKILSLLVFLALNFNYASAEVTYSAFTKEGKALNNELSILNKDDKFRIIFFSDEENEFDLVIKTKNKILNQQKVKISNQITLPGDEKWFQLGKIKDLSVNLSNNETNLELNYRVIELKSQKVVNLNNMKIIGEEKEIEINYSSEPENIKLKDKTLTFDDLVVRSGGNVFKKYSSSVVLINTGDGHGSGFLITKDSIITNWHVIKGYESVGVIFKPRGFNKVDLKNQYIADIVLTDQVKDIALLMLRKQSRSTTPFNLPESPEIEIGEDVHAIGHPMGLDWTYTKGVISQLRPNYRWSYEDGTMFQANIIQTQTPINQGNSGGPLLNDYGEVIGMNTFITAKAQGLNFSVAAIDIVEFVKNYENVENRTISPLNRAKSRMVDIDGDGLVDGEAVDMDENGVLDTFIEKDEDRNLEFWHEDKNGNGVIERMIVHARNDKGKMYAVLYYDEDEDGKFDSRGWDYDYDGKVDFEEKV